VPDEDEERKDDDKALDALNDYKLIGLFANAFLTGEKGHKLENDTDLEAEDGDPLGTGPISKARRALKDQLSFVIDAINKNAPNAGEQFQLR
jgi:hypothetical protein